MPNVWEPIGVEDQPEIDLVHWRVYRIDKYVHFVGYSVTSLEGRVSSRVVDYHKPTQKGKTRTGRVYHLLGAPGFNDDAMYVFKAWCDMYKTKEIEDITEDYYNED